MFDLAELSDSLDLKTFLEDEGVRLKETRGRSGDQLNIMECPFCADRHWKVYANAETGFGNCFKCDETFSKLGFVHAVLGYDHWRDTFSRVRQALKEQGWHPKRISTAAVEFESAKFPESFALPTPEGQNLLYLEERGITTDLARYFHLRFCDRGWWNFTKPDGSKGGQRFDMRVVIPIYDLDGEFVTFQGRDITGTSERKYLFPTGLPGTGRFLLNGQNAVGVKRICIGEGGFDVFAIKAAFDEDVTLRDVVPVGSFGKHLSYGDPDGNDQLGRLLGLKTKGLQEVTLMWDGEPKALVSALDAARQIKRVGLQVRIARLPSGKDPNEVDPQIVREAFWKAEPYTPLIDVRWRINNPYGSAK